MGVKVPKRRTALLLVDVQNDFCSEDGKMAAFGADLSFIDSAVTQMNELLGAARQNGVQVIFIRLVTTLETDSRAMLRFYQRQGLDAASVAVCRAGTEGAEFYRLLPEPGDIVVDKQRYSGFIGTNLELVLRAQAIQSLIIAGVTTECCVDSTARDGFMRDYDTFVVQDACAAYEQDLHKLSLKSMGINFSTIVSTQEVVRSWESKKGEA